jgi:hypothetical protein
MATWKRWWSSSFPLKCSGEQLERFIDGAGAIADGWISFYRGKPADDYPVDNLQGALVAGWPRRFEKGSAQMTRVD